MIFLSYSNTDKDFALKIYHDLNNAGGDIWLDKIKLRGGENYNVAIEKALESSSCVLFIVSEKSVNSKYVLNEVHFAIEEDKEVIPILIYECKLPFRLRGLHHINFLEGYEKGLQALLRSLNLKKKPNKQKREVKNFKNTTQKQGLKSTAEKNGKGNRQRISKIKKPAKIIAKGKVASSFKETKVKTLKQNEPAKVLTPRRVEVGTTKKTVKDVNAKAKEYLARIADEKRKSSVNGSGVNPRKNAKPSAQKNIGKDVNAKAKEYLARIANEKRKSRAEASLRQRLPWLNVWPS